MMVNLTWTWLIWDVFCLLLLGLLIWECARKGFLRKIMSFLGALLSAVAAGFFSAPVAAWLYGAVVRDAIAAVVSRRVAEVVEEGLAAGGDWLSSVPGWMLGMVPEGTALPQAPQAVAEVAPIVEQLIDSALAEPVLMLLRGLCFFFLFAVFMVLARYLARLLGFVNNIPLVGSLNTVLGGVLGIGEALVVLYLLAVIAQLYIASSGGGNDYINPRVLSDGYLFSFFYRLAS